MNTVIPSDPNALLCRITPAAREMMECVPVWFWATDRDHRFIWLSDNWTRLTGGQRKDYLGRSRLEFISGKTSHTPEAARHVRQLKAHEPFRDFTYRHAFDGGRMGWITSGGDPVYDGSGHFAGYRGAALLMSATIDGARSVLTAEAELLHRTRHLERALDARNAALDQSYTLLSEVLEGMDQGLLVYELSDRGEADIVLCNGRFHDLMCLTPEHCPPGGRLGRMLTHCARRGDFRTVPGGLAGLRAAVHEGTPVLLSPGDGKRHILLHTSRRSASLAVVTCTDVTALESRKRDVEKARQESENAHGLLSEVVEAMGEGLLVTDGARIADGANTIVMVNPALRDLFALSGDEVYPGQSMTDFVARLAARGDAESPGNFRAIARQLNAGDAVVMHLPSIGRSYRVKAAARPSGGFVMVHSDVTELRSQNLKLEAARAEAERANSAKSAFLAAMSHEIRTPMNGVIGMAELLMDTPLAPQQRMFVRTILDSGAALTDLIGDVLDFSKIEAGKMALDRAPVDLAALAGDVRALLLPQAQAAGVALSLEVEPGFPPWWLGDGKRLRQILLNLMGNAIKFTHGGSVTVRLARTGDGGAALAVADTGIGIPRDKLDTIFEAFGQVGVVDGRDYGGTGLGLSITRRLVALMDGTLDVRSQPGVGSVFTARLPLIALSDKAQTARRPAETPAGIRPDMTGRTIVVADDNGTNRLVLRHMLAPLGGRIVCCSDGIEAIEAQARHAADLVLMDMSMPRLSGVDAARAIRQSEVCRGRARCAIVALTGNAQASDRAACLAAGMDGFLTKPVRKLALFREIARVMGEMGKTDATPD